MIYVNAAATKTKLDEIKAETQKDATLMTIHRFIMNGWPKRREDVPDEIKPYWSYKEMSVINGVMFKGERLIIPTSMRKDVLKLLHQSHMGIEKTKRRARATIFWPSINTKIEHMIKSCDICQHNKKAQQKETMIATEVPDYPFQMIGTDLFHWNRQDFLLVVDYYSQYWDIERLYNTESETVIKKLKRMFSRFEIPEIIRSNNGPQYASKSFHKFTKDWGIDHVTSSPLYPRANGMAERMVQTVKQILEKSKKDGEDLYLTILDAKNFPATNFKSSPAELALGRQLRSLLPVPISKLKIKEIDEDNFREKNTLDKVNQAKYYNQHAKDQDILKEGDPVRMLHNGKWETANIVNMSNSPRSYIVKMENGKQFRRNRCHLMKNSISDATTIEMSDNEQEMVKVENEYVVVKSNSDAFDNSTDTEDSETGDIGSNNEVRTRSD